MISDEIGEFALGSKIVFTNPDKLKEKDEHPFDFGYILFINGLDYKVVVNDRSSKYYAKEYIINEDNIALYQEGDTLNDFEYIDEKDI